MIGLIVAVLAAAPIPLGGVEWQPVAGTWKAGQGEVWGQGGWLSTTTAFQDGVIELEFDLAKSTSTVGIAFRYQGTAGKADAGGLGVNFAPGTFNVFRGLANTWTPVNPEWKEFQPAKLLRSGRNAVRIELAGKSVKISLNGQPLYSFEDASPLRGPVVLWVESVTESVGFSDFRISAKR